MMLSDDEGEGGNVILGGSGSQARLTEHTYYRCLTTGFQLELGS